ncbi:MAG: hypothetical protein J6Y02_01065 [Pseudobutyrivibrio sp.]|nr:hypothetical protein [Pseudobutyrivibrio sp.]
MIWAELKESVPQPECGKCIANDMIKELEAQYADILMRNFELMNTLHAMCTLKDNTVTVEEEIIFEDT